MGKNYTKPYDENYDDTREDYLFLAMVFSQVLGNMLDAGHGILIDLKGDALKLRPDTHRVVVFNDSKMIRIINADERTDLSHGDRIMMIDGDSITN